MEAFSSMNKTETITIKISTEMMDLIRKESVKGFRSISKQIGFMLNQYIETTKGK